MTCQTPLCEQDTYVDDRLADTAQSGASAWACTQGVNADTRRPDPARRARDRRQCLHGVRAAAVPLRWVGDICSGDERPAGMGEEPPPDHGGVHSSGEGRALGNPRSRHSDWCSRSAGIRAVCGRAAIHRRRAAGLVSLGSGVTARGCTETVQGGCTKTVQGPCTKKSAGSDAQPLHQDGAGGLHPMWCSKGTNQGNYLPPRCARCFPCAFSPPSKTLTARRNRVHLTAWLRRQGTKQLSPAMNHVRQPGTSPRVQREWLRHAANPQPQQAAS